MNLQKLAMEARRLGLCLASLVFILVGLAPDASAQVGHGAILVHGGFIRGVDIAYDPSTGGYMVVGGQGQVIGICVNGDGAPISGLITINNSGFGAFPRARFSPHAGAFLVVWGEEVGSPSEVHARMVNCGGGMGPEQVISGGTNAWIESGAAVDYSESSGKFLVAWKSLSPALLRAVLVDNNGAPASGVVTLSTGFARDPGVAWNPHRDEFGVSFNGESGSTSFSGFVVVPAGNPAAFRRTTFNAFGGGLFTITDVDYDEGSGNYVMGWFELSTGTFAKTAIFNGDGALIGHNVASTRLGSYDALALAWNPATGTSLMTGLDRSNDAVLGLELNGGGTPVRGENTVDATFRPARYPRVAASRHSGTWGNTYSGGPAGQFGGITNFKVSSQGGGGTPPPPPPPPPPDGGGGGGAPPPAPGDPCAPCTTIKPGDAWVCSYGGWLPPGSTSACPGTPPPPGGGGGGGTPPPPAPPPTDPCAACATIKPGPDWVCSYGGWLPPGSTSACTGGGGGGGGTPPPPPPPPPGSPCLTIQPGPDWTCFDGGWWPPGMAPPGGGGGGGTPPPPSDGDGTCTTIKPFPGAICKLGNWYPPDHPGLTGCTTIMPGPGWRCVDGGWRPPAEP